MAKHVKGSAIIAVCDLSQNPEIGRREHAEAGTMIIYRNGRESARTVAGETNPAFAAEMRALGIAFGG